MVNLLPAIIIGGPPHAGKSVLTYSVTQALRQWHVEHFVIRACPDGEGDWSQEIDQSRVTRIRRKGEWTPDFVQSICAALERRHFPLLVDLGGRLEAWQTPILQLCTHSILLLHRHDEATAYTWRTLAATHGLLPIAEMYSELEGESTIDSTPALSAPSAPSPVVRGTLAGLSRSSLARGPLFDMLVERIAALFATYSPGELRALHFQNAPGRVVDVDVFAKMHDPRTPRWEPAMLAPFLETLPRDGRDGQNMSLAIYGRGPNWLYAALALATDPTDPTDQRPFYQFDARLGWVKPPALSTGVGKLPEIDVAVREGKQYSVLSAHPTNDYIDFEQAATLLLPPVSRERGLILDGKLPLWLVTAIARLYFRMGLPWIACNQPQAQGAIVVGSRVPEYAPGQCLPLSAAEAASPPKWEMGPGPDDDEDGDEDGNG